jgi:DUF4097 and DUF4098 domain-containing protein YvlB
MTKRFLITIVSGLLAAPSFAEQDMARRKEAPHAAKVRREWSDRYQASRHGPEVTERFTRTIRIGRTGAFELANVSGNVTITGGNGDEVRIDAVKRARSRDESDAKALLDELRIEVTELPNRVEVRTEHPRNRRNYSGSVDYTVTLPAGVDTTIKVVSGDVRVTNVKGELRAESISGNVVASGAARLAFAKSVSGNVDITDAASEAALSISTISGNLTGRTVKARALELSSVSGDVILTNVTCDRAMVKTTSGNVEYDGPLARAGRYEMHAHSGSVRLGVTSTTGFELEATTFNGDVRSDFPLTLRAGMEDRGARRGPRFNRSIRGSYGDGGAIVTLKSFSGDIVITKR